MNACTLHPNWRHFRLFLIFKCVSLPFSFICYNCLIFQLLLLPIGWLDTLVEEWRHDVWRYIFLFNVVCIQLFNLASICFNKYRDFRIKNEFPWYLSFDETYFFYWNRITMTYYYQRFNENYLELSSVHCFDTKFNIILIEIGFMRIRTPKKNSWLN